MCSVVKLFIASLQIKIKKLNKYTIVKAFIQHEVRCLAVA